MSTAEGGDETAPFDEVLAVLIRQADMTVPEVARAADLDDQTIRTYLDGNRKPRLASVRRLERALRDPNFTMRKSLGIELPADQHTEDVLQDFIFEQQQLRERQGRSASGAAFAERLDRFERGQEQLIRAVAELARRIEELAPAATPTDSGAHPGQPT